jgi:hypothetical protein
VTPEVQAALSRDAELEAVLEYVGPKHNIWLRQSQEQKDRHVLAAEVRRLEMLLQITIDAGCTNEDHLLLRQERDHAVKVNAGLRAYLLNYSDVDMAGDHYQWNAEAKALMEMDRLEAER